MYANVIYIYICMYVCVSISISMNISIYLSIDLSIYRSMDLWIYRSIDLSIYLSIYHLMLVNHRSFHHLMFIYQLDQWFCCDILASKWWSSPETATKKITEIQSQCACLSIRDRPMEVADVKWSKRARCRCLCMDPVQPGIFERCTAKLFFNKG